MTATSLTALEVCKDAMAMIGAGEITIVSSPVTDAEKTCARMYSLVTGMLFARYQWGFVSKQLELVEDEAKTAEQGYSVSHTLPAALLSGPFAVYAEGDLENPVSEFVRQGNYIFSDYEQVDILYNVAIDPAAWPEYFRTLVTVALAMRLAKPIADNTALQTELRIEAFGNANEGGSGGLFAVAKKLASKTRSTKSIFQNGDPLTSARLGSTGIVRRFRTV